MLFQTYRKKHFLIVDDFDNFIFSLRQMLRSLGAERIDSAKNGQEAVALCRRNHYDVVFCDYNMGDGSKNGQQVLEELRHRKLLKHTSIFIIISAEVARDIVFAALEHQPDCYITKPITRASLQKRLDVLLEQKESLRPILEAMDLEDYNQAIALCAQEIKRDTKYKSWCIKTMANLYFQSGDLARAKEIYQDTIRQRPLDWALLGLGKVQLEEQDIEAAIETFQSILKDNERCVEAYDWLAEAYRRQGLMQKAQETLKQAVTISPRALLRQKSLAEISLANQDLPTATQAYRHTARLSEHSVHESPEIYLSFSRCLSDLMEEGTIKVDDGMTEEAMRTLHKVRVKYGDQPEVRLQSLMVESRMQASQGKLELGRKTLKQAKELLSTLEDSKPELALEMAQAFYSLKQPQAAQQLLTELAGKHSDDTALMVKIEEMMDEPVGLQEKLRARDHSRQGIRAYEQGDYQEAIAQFQAALAIIPDHAALNLNLIQVLLKSAGDAKPSPDILKQCQYALRRIGDLSPSHRQYKRFVHFSQRLKELGE